MTDDVAARSPRRPMVGDPQLWYLLAIAGAGSLLYGVQILVDVARPVMGRGPRSAVGLLDDPWPVVFRVTFWAVVFSWLVVLVAACLIVVWRRVVADPVMRDRGSRAAKFYVVGVLLLPFTVLPVYVLFGHPLVMLVCLPSTAFGLWLVRRMQRYRRVPLALLLAVFGWGALVATGFGGSMNVWVMEYGPAYGLAVDDDLVRIGHHVYTAIVASAGLFEELGKGTGVAIAYLLFRRYVDDVVSGIVLGAAAGLGFNLTESVEYIFTSPGSGADVQYWMRQSVGLMAAHTAFTAVIGAGFGVARQLREPRLRLIAIGCGYVGAAGSHFANDILLPRLNQLEHAWLHPSPTVDVLVAQPLVLLCLQSPLVVVYLLLLHRGLRGQARTVAAELHAEAATGSGAVTDPEIPILLRPGRRFRFRVTALRRYGLPAYRTLGRLHVAQYDLATQRRRQTDYGDRAVDGDTLRERIHDLRGQLQAHARPVEAT